MPLTFREKPLRVVKSLGPGRFFTRRWPHAKGAERSLRVTVDTRTICRWEKKKGQLNSSTDEYVELRVGIGRDEIANDENSDGQW
mmetsp:Transcript_8785/g.12952  ORF Transcript_8785/g.12952 Transcript_8785/m.12952 type:complete len:85 (-) Transcript_8785:225-479(-)